MSNHAIRVKWLVQWAVLTILAALAASVNAVDEGDRWILSFDEYRAAQDWEHHVQQQLHYTVPSTSLLCNMTVAPRRNVMSKYPTDFLLAMFDGDEHDCFSLRDQLQRLSHVKRIAPDRKLTRGIKQAAPIHSFTGGRVTPSSWSCGDTDHWDHMQRRDLLNAKRSSHSAKYSLVHLLGVEALWELGYTGQDIHVAVFDTGISESHPHIHNIVDRTDWTDESRLDDALGHGSFVAGVVASHKSCRGLAPNVNIHAYRLFTLSQTSFTSWFLDAFNFAMHRKIHVLNLSIGGPDFRDEPFVDKVNELTASGVVMVSAVGNDGPVYGTLNNPADQASVVGVGGVDYDQRIAAFSSRGMTLWEQPSGYGRFKPDVVAYGLNVLGSAISGGCHTLSGTSVASPVIAGAAALLASVVPEHKRDTHFNPASVKQALHATAIKLNDSNIFEQGAGLINISAAALFMDSFQPKVTSWPMYFDATECPYFGTYCQQALFAGSQPLVVNFTLLNSVGPLGTIQTHPKWNCKQSIFCRAVDVDFTFSETLWPWSGYLAFHVAVNDAGHSLVGTVQGDISLTVTTYDPATQVERRSNLLVPVVLRIQKPPPRAKRIFWDMRHSLTYPSGYFPRDSLAQADPLDWHGDHPHTNFRSLFLALYEQGYVVEFSGDPLTCVDLSKYGVLAIVDPEDEFFPEEIAHVNAAVSDNGLGLLVVGEWYNTQFLDAVEFFDDNTQNQWYPETGGSNIPALNQLLEPWGMSFGSHVVDGRFTYKGDTIDYLSGSTIVAFPAGGYLVSAMLEKKVLGGRDDTHFVSGGTNRYPVIGLHQVDVDQGSFPGRIVLYGDSGCLDDAGRTAKKCINLVSDMLEFLTQSGGQGRSLVELAMDLASDIVPDPQTLPKRASKSTLHLYSRVMQTATERKPLPTCMSYKWQRHSSTDRDGTDEQESQEQKKPDASEPLARLAQRLHYRPPEYVTVAEDLGSGYNVFAIGLVVAGIALLLWSRRPRRRQRSIYLGSA
eukprot:m.275764 g.275764  ORF g.275764 m.275764 type:complete len:1005 (-) comp15698_c0_seq7:2011-5025(-)